MKGRPYAIKLRAGKRKEREKMEETITVNLTYDEIITTLVLIDTGVATIGSTLDNAPDDVKALLADTILKFTDAISNSVEVDEETKRDIAQKRAAVAEFSSNNIRINLPA